MAADYQEVTGHAVSNFHCPILYRDEDVRLCAAHLVNAGFRDSPRTWTVQRHDVDSFFADLAEEDFLKIQEKGQHSPLEVVTDKRLRRQMKPKIVAGGHEIDHFVPTSPVPKRFTRLKLPGSPGVELALKLTPDETLTLTDREWRIGVELDLRLPALIALLKAAHLTLFEMQGYRYALSAGGRFLGWDILGSFYAEHAGSPRAARIKAAAQHFPQFVQMARPLQQTPDWLRPTSTDGMLFLCGAGHPWAMLTFIKVGRNYHSVLVPVFEEVDGAAHFVRFLENPDSQIAARLARWTGGGFEVSPEISRFDWPPHQFFDESGRLDVPSG